MEFSKSKFIILFNILVGAILYLKVEYSLKNIRIFIFASWDSWELVFIYKTNRKEILWMHRCSYTAWSSHLSISQKQASCFIDCIMKGIHHTISRNLCSMTTNFMSSINQLVTLWLQPHFHSFSKCSLQRINYDFFLSIGLQPWRRKWRADASERVKTTLI